MTRNGPPAIHLADCRSLVITAWFGPPTRIAVDSYWSVMLDGILAGALVDLKRVRPTDIAPLPLARHRLHAAGQWSWAATMGTPLDLVATTAGGWGSRWERDPAPETMACTGMEWRAVGQEAEIGSLLANVTHVGNRSLNAAVLRWTVIDVGEPDLNHTTWLPSGYIARPLAERISTVLGLVNPETVNGAVRPPYWRAPPTNVTDTFDRQWRPVIAPWTRRPTD